MRWLGVTGTDSLRYEGHKSKVKVWAGLPRLGRQGARARLPLPAAGAPAVPTRRLLTARFSCLCASRCPSCLTSPCRTHKDAPVIGLCCPRL